MKTPREFVICIDRMQFGADKYEVGEPSHTKVRDPSRVVAIFREEGWGNVRQIPRFRVVCDDGYLQILREFELDSLGGMVFVRSSRVRIFYSVFRNDLPERMVIRMSQTLSVSDAEEALNCYLRGKDFPDKIRWKRLASAKSASMIGDFPKGTVEFDNQSGSSD